MAGRSPVEDLERLWNESQSPPDIFDFIAQTKIPDNRQLADLLLCDQYRRWKAGIAIPVEDYFEACPQLDADESLKLELIEEEYGYREEESGAPNVDEFLSRFGFLSESARLQLLDSIQLDSQASRVGAANRNEHRQIEMPDQIDRFKILETIGKGAFGVVYKGQDAELQRLVAIKVPTQSRIEKAGGTEAFLKEARVVAGLDHPAIVPVYDVGTTTAGACYLVTKFIDGVDLRYYMGQRLSFAESARLIATIADALHYAHRQGLVHRDVKPANILIDKSGNPHLVDFGLALRDEEFGSGAGLVGTPAYMSPEQAAGRGNRVDGRSDIYSLGVVFYEMLTKRRPYRADSSTDMIELVKNAEVRPPRQVDDAIPQELDRICLMALAREPRGRFSTARDLAMALNEFCDSTDSVGGTSRSDTVANSMVSPGHPTLASTTQILSDEASNEVSVVTGGSTFMKWLGGFLVVAAAAIGSAIWINWDPAEIPDDRTTSLQHVRQPNDVPTGALTPEQVSELQLNAAKALSLPMERRMGDRLVLKLIPAGEFQMGSSRDEIDLLPLDDWFFVEWQRERMYNESPRHNVTISKPFYMSAHEVTVAQFRRFIEATAYTTTAELDPEGGYGWVEGVWQQSPEFGWTNIGFDQGDEHPVCNVSWDDAVAYCEWLSNEEQATIRLPTEAEWEYACRAGSTTWFFNGDRDQGLKLIGNIADQSLSAISDVVQWGCNWDDDYPFTAPVGRFQPNAFGLYDMHGNAWEWCHDWYGERYYGQSPAKDPQGPDFESLQEAELVDLAKKITELKKKAEQTNAAVDWSRLKWYEELTPTQYHVFRGGGWDNYPGFCRSADRYSSHSPQLRTQWAGFRIVCEIE
ncbi:MAG: bifunctional serine/threonine-protein kinase/formylglycine-generating enzyme family protein [Planctomycetota bacterium]